MPKYFEDPKSAEAVRLKFKAIFRALTEKQGISPQTLGRFYARGGRTRDDVEAEPLDPAVKVNWDRAIFRQNASSCFRDVNPTDVPLAAMKRLIDCLDELKLVRRVDLEYHAEKRKTWIKPLKIILDQLTNASVRTGDAAQPSPKGSRDKNLIFMGNAEEAIARFASDEFKDIRTSATQVYNTVFSRKHEKTHHILKAIPQFEKLKKEMIEGNCSWVDIALPKEIPALRKSYREISKDKRENYQIGRIATELPLFQCLVLRVAESEVGVALVGWWFLGQAESRVFFTRNGPTVRYFYDYCAGLFERHTD